MQLAYARGRLSGRSFASPEQTATLGMTKFLYMAIADPDLDVRYKFSWMKRGLR